MKMVMQQQLQQKQKLVMTQEMRLAIKLRQQLKLKMSLKQVIKIIQRLWPKMTLQLGQSMHQHFSKILKTDKHLQEALPTFLQSDPTAVQLQTKFPQLAPVFNEYYKSQPDYGTQLRRKRIVIPSKRSTHSLALKMTTRMAPLQMQIKTKMWSLVDAFQDEGKDGCSLPKKHLPKEPTLADRLKKVDTANRVFRFSYRRHGNKFYRIPLLRNLNVNPNEIKVQISKEEYNQATDILDKAGRVQRIVRAVPYSEIRETLIDYLDTRDIDLDDLVLVGVDRGGRLPTHIVKKSLGMDKAYFLKVDQGGRSPDMGRLDQFINHGTLRGKYVMFVDSTVDSGRQISALQKYFDDEDFKCDLGHVGWVVVGSNEYGKSLQDHLNLDWGLDPDESFEDNPKLMGVDYGSSFSTIQAFPNSMSSFLRNSLREVAHGVILEGTYISESPIVKQVGAKRKQKPSLATILLIGDGKNQTLEEDDARKLALKIEHGFHVLAGTTLGNPGYILELVDAYPEKAGITLVQPSYMKNKAYTNGFPVTYEGTTKDKFRDCMIAKADLVLALGGNEGTLTEIYKAIKTTPTIVVRDFGEAGRKASSISSPNLFLMDSFGEVFTELAKYR